MRQNFFVSNALKSPEFLISKLNLSTSLQEIFTNLYQYDENTVNNLLIDFQTQFSNIEKALKIVYKELEQHSKSILEIKLKIRNELKKIIKFDQFQQFSVNLEQLGDSINIQAIEQNEKNLHEYLQELTKNNCQELNLKLIDVLERIQREPKNLNEEQYPQCRKLQNYFKSFNLNQQSLAQYDNLLNIVQCSTKYDGELLSSNQLCKIINYIQSKLNKKVKTFQQIYFGTKDGLNGKVFWNKVNEKSNLLMIFKSKSGFIFGGFSPCQWQQSLNNYVKDNTWSSFLFSQTHDQIYPLKGDAFYCNLQYGPTFGGDFYKGSHDIYIDKNFQEGYSNLGTAYQCDQYQIVNTSTHLFGQVIPRIEECEIYQVIYV